MSRSPKAVDCWCKGRVRSFHKKQIRKKKSEHGILPLRKEFGTEKITSLGFFHLFGSRTTL